MYRGRAATLVKRARGSAVKLVDLIASSFPGFRDQAVYRGRQVFLYKRAQIFVADVYGAFKGRGYGWFKDLHKLTMFADYRVPVVLRKLGGGILHLSPELQQKVCSGIVRESVMPSACWKHAATKAAVIQNATWLWHMLSMPQNSCASRVGVSGYWIIRIVAVKTLDEMHVCRSMLG
jgi:hypothetical protein